MKAKTKLIQNKQGKKVALLLCLFVVVNWFAGYIWPSYPDTFVLVAVILFSASTLNYLLLNKPKISGQDIEITSKERKRLKIELVSYFLVLLVIAVLLLTTWAK